MDVETFIQHFHNIQGANLAEKQKNFNFLLKNIPPDHEALLSSLTPKNQFENLLKLKLLLKLQRVAELLQVLQSEEEYLPAKLLKNKWFCRKLAQTLNESTTGFVDGVLPFTSYVIRRRIITKLAIHGTNLDTVYDEIKTRYGIHMASTLLVACSASKIQEILTNNKVSLTPLCQKLLYQKQPQLFVQYIKDHHVEDTVLNFVARCKINDFVEAAKNLFLGTTLGKHLTKKLLNNAKEVVIANADKFSCMIHLKTAIKALSDEELKRFFFNCCPAKIEDFRHYGHIGFNNLEKKLGSRFYFLLLETTEKKFKKSLYDFPDLISAKMMETMDVEERLKWVSIKKQNGMSEDDLIPFLRAEEAIALIKSKINVTSSIKGRSGLVQLLVKTCQVNGDWNALAEVGEYVCSRHKNDNELILNDFLYKIQELFPLEKLGERHWKFINTLCATRRNNCWYLCDFTSKYIEFLFRENKLTDDKILDFFKLTKRERYRTGIKDLRKLLLLKSVEFLPTLLDEQEKIEYADLALLSNIFQWNKAHKDDQIPIFEYPRLIESLKKSMKDAIEGDSYFSELHVLESILATIICSKDTSEFRDETIRNYFSMGYRFFNIDIDMWLLKHQPSIIETHFDKFLHHLLHSYSPNLLLLNHISRFTSSSFQEKIVSRTLVNLQNPRCTDVVFHVLVILEPADDFLKHVAPFYPSDDKIREESEDEERKDSRAIAVARSFKYATSPKVLPTLIRYCKGDFLRYSLESLYYLFYHSPENQLSAFINELSSKAVSVRKHSLFLTCTVGSVNDVQKLLTRFIENERNVSVQKHLFTAALKYFVKNPSDDFWECVKVCMSKLDRNDTESFKMLLNLNQIPKRYQAQHVIYVFGILKKNEDSRPRLLSSIPSSLFKDLSLEFLLEVITENFLKTRSGCVNVINDFVVTSLTQSPYRVQILDTIFGIIKQLKVSDCTLEEEASRRKKLNSFVMNLVGGVELSDSYEVLLMFSQRWHELFSVTQAIQEHLQLSFALFYLQEGKDLIKFAKSVAELLEGLVTTYGVVIVDCFASALRDSLTTLCCYGEANMDYLRFVLYLVKNWDNLVFQLLAIKLLPQELPSYEDRKEIFVEIVQILRQVPHESVQMLMNVFVMDMEV